MTSQILFSKLDRLNNLLKFQRKALEIQVSSEKEFLSFLGSTLEAVKTVRIRTKADSAFRAERANSPGLNSSSIRFQRDKLGESQLQSQLDLSIQSRRNLTAQRVREEISSRLLERDVSPQLDSSLRQSTKPEGRDFRESYNPALKNKVLENVYSSNQTENSNRRVALKDILGSSSVQAIGGSSALTTNRMHLQDHQAQNSSLIDIKNRPYPSSRTNLNQDIEYGLEKDKIERFNPMGEKDAFSMNSGPSASNLEDPYGQLSAGDKSYKNFKSTSKDSRHFNAEYSKPLSNTMNSKSKELLGSSSFKKISHTIGETVAQGRKSLNKRTNDHSTGGSDSVKRQNMFERSPGAFASPGGKNRGGRYAVENSSNTGLALRINRNSRKNLMVRKDSSPSGAAKRGLSPSQLLKLPKDSTLGSVLNRFSENPSRRKEKSPSRFGNLEERKRIEQIASTYSKMKVAKAGGREPHEG